MRYSAEQAAILSDQNVGHKIVSAQAGAGKTSVLVERILRYIDARIPLRRMLIVTFTKKAANEMKTRIRKGLLERAERGGDRAWFLEQLADVAAANIQTMHAFSLEILQEYAMRIGRDPGFSILDDTLLARLQEEALDEVLQDVYVQADAQRLSFLERYGYRGRRNDEALRALVRTLFMAADKKPNPNQWLREQCDFFFCDDFPKEVYERRLKDLVDSYLRPLVEQIFYLDKFLYEESLPEKVGALLGCAPQPFGQMMLASGSPRMDSCIDSSGEQSDIPLRSTGELRSLLDFLGDGTVHYAKTGWEERFFAQAPQLLSAMRSRVPPAFPRYTRKLSKEEEAAEDAAQKVDNAERVKGYRDRIKAAFFGTDGWLSAIADFDFQQIVEECAQMANDFSQLAELTANFAARYQEKKKQEGGMDFSDVEHEMCRLLEDDSVRRTLSERYRYIFFDEYQDSSRIQDEIVDALAQEDNLFFVGDIKQSIYAFRQARPQNFLERYARYQADPQAHALDLTQNFRTKQAPIDFFNFLFSDLMTPQRGDVLYDTPGHRAVRGVRLDAEGAPLAEDPTAFPGHVHLCILQDSKERETPVEEEEDPDFDPALDEESVEAFYVAAQIQKLVRAGEHYRDCAVLFRTNTRIASFERVLTHFGIPCFSEMTVGTHEPLEVKIFLQILSLLDNPHDDTALLAALRSCMAGLDDAQLAKIRVQAPEGPFYSACQQALEAGDPLLQEKLQRFFATLTRLREARQELPFSDFGWRVLVESGLYVYAGALENGRERRANLEAVLRLMAAYEAGGGSSLSDFLSSVKTESSAGGADLPTAVELSEEDDVVRLMTMHKSKGLEFENVFLVDLGRAFSKKEKQNDLVIHDTLGSALRLYRFGEAERYIQQIDPVWRKVVLAQVEREQRSEAVRILYVACTRAESRLFLVGTTKSLAGMLVDGSMSLDAVLSRDTSYLAWLVHRFQYDDISAAVTEPAEATSLAAQWSCLRQSDYYAERGLSKDGVSLEISDADRYRTAMAKAIDAENVCADTVPDFVRLFDTPYPYVQDTVRPIKRTVSEMAKKNQKLDPHFLPWPKMEKWSMAAPTEGAQSAVNVPVDRALPQFLKPKTEPSPTEWGSLMHLALSQLPLTTYTANTLQAALDRLVAREIFTEQERGFLDEKLLLQFFNSSLAEEIRAHRETVQRERAFTLQWIDLTRLSAAVPHAAPQRECDAAMWRKEDAADRLPTVLVDGQVDLYYETEEGLVLLDFKTDRKPEPERYRLQLALYCEGLERALHKPVVRTILYWVRSGQETTFAREELRRVAEDPLH